MNVRFQNLRSKLNTFRRQALLLAFVALIVVFVLWNVPQLGFLLYPIRLFVTFVHEGGHSLVALLTGGHVSAFVVNADGSGFARTTGNFLLILPAGYLGAAFFGAALFYIVNTVPFTRAISMLVGGGLVLATLITLLFASINTTAFIVGVIFGLLLIGLGWKVRRDVNMIVLDVLAMLAGLNAVLDLLYLVSNDSASLGSVRNDAAAFSNLITPILPGAVWAFVWAAIAVIMLGMAVYWSVIHPLRQRESLE